MKEAYIFDASPLIYLGKAKVLHTIKILSLQNIIPLSVYTEVITKGKERGEPDAAYVETLIHQHLFQVQKVEAHPAVLKNISRLTIADIDVLTLALQNQGRALTDDEAVRTVARIEGIKVGGTIYLLLRLIQAGKISKMEAKEILDEIIRQGWRCSAEGYSLFLKKLEL